MLFIVVVLGECESARLFSYKSKLSSQTLFIISSKIGIIFLSILQVLHIILL